MTTLKEFTRGAARRFLQSAVFVDDKIYQTDSGMPIQVPEAPVRKPFLRTQAPLKNTESLPTDPVDVPPPYQPKDLVSSFAREGIICALYEPPKDFATNADSEIFKLCERPDIIILDWDFSGDQGRKSLDLISALVGQSSKEFPHHIRLLAIYTADQSLTAVANKIADRLKADGFPSEPERSQCRLRTGATRLIVLGKNIARFGEDEKEFTVQESDLADRLIGEFADMNSGLLPSYALHGMAAVRRNSKRVLDRFHHGLNGAFLLHRAFSLESEEAFDQLPALLAEELLAVLEDKHLDQNDISQIAKDAIESLSLRVPERDWRKVSGAPLCATKSVSAEVVKELLNTGGVDRKKYASIQEIQAMPTAGFRGVDTSLMKDLTFIVDADGSSANERLASLFTSRTQYSPSRRELSYGTIVRSADAKAVKRTWTYSFCVMPLCDCLRLDKTSQFADGKPIMFPFWRLKHDVFSGSNASRRGIAISLPDGSHITASAGGKARDMLWLESFPVDPATGTITALPNPKGEFVLKTHDEVRIIEWIAQLKPLHAQRIAFDIGQGLSRVGLVEAEWLRLLCDR